jgi:aspartate kinase
MKVFKFGGASVKDPKSIRNTVEIIQQHSGTPLLVVVSAMGKTTNALEKIHELSHAKKDFRKELADIKNYHTKITYELFPTDHMVHEVLDKIFEELEESLQLPYPFDQVYDQVISKGELISSYILHHFLLKSNISSVWVDARQYIVTDETYREGKVNWELTEEKIETLERRLEDNIVLTQGFIGSTLRGFTTTLGREGSDFSAAIFASCLNAESVTIWKDVPGVMSSDPKRLPNAIVFDELPYKEAAEMTYYGASVIHPKTIKPLANRNIPLHVKNFDDPSLPGTIIHDCKVPNLPPLIVFKDNQCLISCKVTDYSFINEQQLGMIFNALSELDVRMNMMQNSAITFSFCIDFRESKVSPLIKKLHDQFEVYYNVGLTLITVKNYDTATFETYRKHKGLLMEQVSRSTLQVLVKS